MSQQDIAYASHLSRPTVTANLNELEDDGLICKSGQIESDQIGRKAIAYSIIPDCRIAIGVEFLRSMVKIVAVDLYGRKIRREVPECRFANELPCYDRVCRSIDAFIRASCPFQETDDFIHISKMPSHNMTMGVALYFIQEFLDDVDFGKA